MQLERVDEHTRVVNTGKTKYTIRRRDNVDLWDIKTEVGVLPNLLQGSFTTPQHAYNKIADYLASKEK